jgi:hypothetical protein
MGSSIMTERESRASSRSRLTDGKLKTIAPPTRFLTVAPRETVARENDALPYGRASQMESTPFCRALRLRLKTASLPGNKPCNEGRIHVTIPEIPVRLE